MFKSGNQWSSKSQVSRYIATEDSELMTTKDYVKVVDIVTRLIENGTVAMGRGYCIGMSDILFTILNQQGIKCRTVECSLVVDDGQNINIVGVEGMKQSGEVDTHVVVVTDTEIPMLIDLSIMHVVDKIDYYVLIERLEISGDFLCNVEHRGLKISYKENVKNVLPMLHQRSIVDRIQTDMKIFDILNRFRILIFVILFISASNAIRGGIDFYRVYFDESNYWGPVVFERMDQRLKNIEEKLK